MFATLILQLPTEEGYTGGKLIVKHHKEEKHFDCHMVSPLGFCYTAFFADCIHQLKPIKSGTRLCLVFNLIKCDPSLDPLHRDFISSKVHRAEEALEPWLQEATEGSINTFGGKLAICLRHKYTEGNLSFSRLKGEDSVVAEVLRECRDKSREPWLDLHLCLVTKYQCGVPSRPSYGRRRRQYYYDSDPDFDSYCGSAGVQHFMAELHEEKIEFKNWIGVDDSPPSGPFKDLGIDLEMEVVGGEDPFVKPDDEEYESYTGNSGPTLEYWYHTAMLVLWPTRKSISIACETGVSGALDWLERTTETTDVNFSERLLQVVCYCEKNRAQVWGAKGDSGEDAVTPRLISLCTSANLPEILSQVFQLLPKDFTFKSPKSYYDKGIVRTAKVGVRNAEVVKAIATSIKVFGWESVSSSIVDVVKGCALSYGESFAQLAKECYEMENQSAGAVVAITMFEVFEERIPELNSHPMPVFTWCQPDAKLPEYPAIEHFLRGPQEKYVHPVQGLPNARSFGDTNFNHSGTRAAGYCATATAGGKGRDAFCEIQKTRYLFQMEDEQWRKEQEVMQGLKSTLEKLRSDVHEAISAAMTPIFFGD